VGRRTASGQVTIGISNLVGIDNLPCEEIAGKLLARLSKMFDPPFEGVWRPTPRLWEEVLKIVRAERPIADQKIGELDRMVAASRPALGRRSGGLEVFERDAVASALQTFGGSAFRKKILKRAGPPPSNPAVAPFLSQLREVSVREDPQIIHDQSTFPGLEVAVVTLLGTLCLQTDLKI
jgi:hypothetical protein